MNKEIRDNVFVMYHRKNDNNICFVVPNKWPSLQSSGEVADGVVIISGDKSLVVAPTISSTALPWSSASVSGGGQVGGSRAGAMNDWNGKANTASQVTHSECSGVDYAPGFCNHYSWGNMEAGKWWLPSVGEMLMIYANRTKINSVLSLINGAGLITEENYWTSSETNSSSAWTFRLSDGFFFGYRSKYAEKFKVLAVSNIT